MPTRSQRLSTSNLSNQPLRLKWLSNIHNEANDQGYDEFRFRTISGDLKTATISRGKACSAYDLYRELHKRNADLPLYDHGGKELVRKALSKKPLRIQTAAAHLGWQKSGCFVHPGWTPEFENEKQSDLVLPLELTDGVQRLAVRGSVDDWVRTVGASAKNSSSIRLVLAATFAAPLLEICHWEPFVIVLHGPSKIGKTFALRVAGSVIGFGSPADLPKFNATRASLLEQATGYRDIVFLIDETKGSRDQPKFSGDFDSFIYAISGGSDDRRHSSFSKGANATTGNIRTIALCTSETPRRSRSERSGVKLDGSLARAFDVSAARLDAKSIFDIVPKSKIGNETWTRRRFERLGKGLEENYGMPFQAFIQHLNTLGHDKVRLKAKKMIASFEETVGASKRNPIAQHGAKSFGLLYAGACLACEAGLIPLPQEQLLQTLSRQYRTAFASVRDQSELELAGFKKLVRLLKAENWPIKSKVSQFIHSPDFRGFVRTKGSTQCFYLKREWLVESLNGDEVGDLFVPTMRYCAARSILQVTNSKTAESSNYSSTTTRRFCKIDGRQMAWIVLADPCAA